MKAIKTKQDLLDYMEECNACLGATLYVTHHPSDSAKEIWQTCHRVDWMIWLGARRNLKVALRYAKMVAARTQIQVFDGRCPFAAHATAFDAQVAGGSDETERQLKELRSMW